MALLISMRIGPSLRNSCAANEDDVDFHGDDCLQSQWMECGGSHVLKVRLVVVWLSLVQCIVQSFFGSFV